MEETQSLSALIDSISSLKLNSPSETSVHLLEQFSSQLVSIADEDPSLLTPILDPYSFTLPSQLSRLFPSFSEEVAFSAKRCLNDYFEYGEGSAREAFLGLMEELHKAVDGEVGEEDKEDEEELNDKPMERIRLLEGILEGMTMGKH
jgi:hypothetical protein